MDEPAGAQAARRQRIGRFVFFALLLVGGLVVARDYGISWDEPIQREVIGWPNYLYAFRHGSRPAEDSQTALYGPVHEMALIAVEKALHLKDSRPIYLVRHAINFLVFFLAVLVFHRLLRRRLSFWPALAGAVFLLLSPRIFADAFFNSKDAILLCFYVFALGSLDVFLRRPDGRGAALHALMCGLLIDVRIVGVVLPAITVLLVVAAWLVGRWPEKSLRGLLGTVGVFTVSTAAVVVLFWPALWRNPLHVVNSYKLMAKFDWTGPCLYFGEMVTATQLPWHYIPVWIAITTPLAYLALVVGGLAGLLVRLARTPLTWLREQPLDAAMLLAWSLPLGAVIVLHSTLYDGWRHLFFIYPPLLYFAVLCFAGLLDAARTWRPWLRLAPLAAMAAVLACAAETAFFMVRNHPHQNVYFNRLAGRNLQEIKPRFEVDYWGLSCRRGLEYIVTHDDAPDIPICWTSHPVLWNAMLLPPEQRQRLRWVPQAKGARYFVTHFRFHPEEYPADNEVFCVKVDGAKILIVQRLDGE
jgi:hypothetical protein